MVEKKKGDQFELKFEDFQTLALTGKKHIKAVEEERINKNHIFIRTSFNVCEDSS